MTAACRRDELRTLFLFESLSDEQLDRLCRDGQTITVEPGPLFAEGDPARCLYVLLEGEIALSKRSGGTDIEMLRSSQRGAYLGAWSAFLEGEQTYEVSARVLRPSRMYVLGAERLGEFMRTEFPMACHFLVGQSLGRFRQHRILGPHDRLVQLGRLTAGLTHELNNPAAAAVRATAELRTRVTALRRRLALLADGTIDRAIMADLVAIGDDVADLVARSHHHLTPLQKADREEEIGTWLRERGIDNPWELAGTYAEAGLDTDHLQQIAGMLSRRPDAPGESVLREAVEWLTGTIETELLMAEITDATTRVSDLVSRAKQYSQLDRAPFDYADVGDLLDTTVAMLGHRIGDIKVVTDYDVTLPKLPCWPAELNQVWTHLIDNAVAAMREAATTAPTLTLRTLHQGDVARVEVCDNGPGVPDDLRERIFDPFFTTRGVGEGTGLGLDLSARIVDKHGGSLWAESTPGDTRFITVLPLTPANPTTPTTPPT